MPDATGRLSRMLQPHERLYFIHIPKTAGTTLTPLIDMHFAEREIFPAQLWRELVHIPQEDFPSYRLFRGHFGGDGLDAFLPEPPVCMTMLRAPVPLTISTYKFIWREPGTRVHDLVRGNDMTIEKFLENKRTRNKASDKQVRHLSFNLEHDADTGPIFHHHESRAAVDKWVQNRRSRIPAGERLERAKAKLDACRFFGLVERFEESMALMAYAFGWPPIGRVQKLMVAPKKSADDELSDALRDRILDFNRLDAELYDYAERIFDERLAAMHADLARFAPRPDADRVNGVPAPSAMTTTKNGAPASFDFEQTYDLLDRRYLALRGNWNEPKHEQIRVSFDEPLWGDGWHRREPSAIDGSTFRWTGPGTRSIIDLNVSIEDDAMLTFCIINVLEESILDGLCVSVNDTPVPVKEISHKASGRVFQGIVPVSALRCNLPCARIALTVPHTVTPKAVELHSDDAREVGLAVNWIDIAPRSDRPEGDVPEETLGPAEAQRRRERRRKAVLSGLKHRVSQIPIIGPRLRNAYIRIRNR